MLEVARLLIELVRALAWPAVTLLVLLLLQGTIAEILPLIARRITKLSIAGFRMDMAKIVEAQVPPQFLSFTLESVSMEGAAPLALSLSAEPDPNIIIRRPGIIEWLDQMGNEAEPSYVVIGLGPASEPTWFTTRLYILAIMLQMRGLRCIVFTEGRRGGKERFVGTASPHQIRWSLAKRYSWLELAYARAYCGIQEQPTGAGQIWSDTGTFWCQCQRAADPFYRGSPERSSSRQYAGLGSSSRRKMGAGRLA
jgi:hypothetical protein